jgi:hypothetical protein
MLSVVGYFEVAVACGALLLYAKLFQIFVRQENLNKLFNG